MNIFILKLFTRGTNEHDAGAQDYCFENNLASIGWGLKEENLDGDESPETLLKMTYDKYQNDSNFKTSSNNLSKMKPGDFVWTQYNDARDFRLGKIKYDKCFVDTNKLIIGLSRHCEWHTVDFNDVPGEIINSYQRKSRTLIMKHNLDNFQEYFEYLYDPQSTLNKKLDYQQLFHYDDLEDLLGLYLQVEENYYILPSTNKTSTKLIEYELRKKEKDGTIKKACVQCKTGDAVVDDTIFEIEDFNDYHIYISTMKNDNYDPKGTNVTTIHTDKLWAWAKEHRDLLPGRINKYIDICK